MRLCCRTACRESVIQRFETEFSHRGMLPQLLPETCLLVRGRQLTNSLMLSASRLQFSASVCVFPADSEVFSSQRRSIITALGFAVALFSVFQREAGRFDGRIRPGCAHQNPVFLSSAQSEGGAGQHPDSSAGWATSQPCTVCTSEGEEGGGEGGATKAKREEEVG